jgi:hypothetical protein
VKHTEGRRPCKAALLEPFQEALVNFGELGHDVREFSESGAASGTETDRRTFRCARAIDRVDVTGQDIAGDARGPTFRVQKLGRGRPELALAPAGRQSHDRRHRL